MPIIESRCPSCGSNIEIKDKTKPVICPFCSNSFLYEETSNNYNVTNNVTNNIQAENVTIVQQSNESDFIIVANELQRYQGLSAEVIIPDNVISIGEYAFNELNIKSVCIPSSVKQIKNFAFRSCQALTSITFPNSVTTIGVGAFQNCCALTSIIIPKTVQVISEYMFDNCISTSSIELHDGILSIEPEAFRNCISLTSLSFPAKIQKLGHHVFRGCKSITSVIIPETISCIETGLFQDCESLSSVTIPSSVTQIKPFAFENCCSLTSITIPNSLNSIGPFAFNNCFKLVDVYLPNKNIKIDYTEGVCEAGHISNGFRDTGNIITFHYPDGTSFKNSPKKGCYVATCVYGNYNCPQVWTLRRFRDFILAKKWYGRAFIRLYYTISPTIVRLFGNNKTFRSIFKYPLDCLITHLKEKGISDTPYQDE